MELPVVSRWRGLRARLMLFVSVVLTGPLAFAIHLAYDSYTHVRAHALTEIVEHAEGLANLHFGIGAPDRILLQELARSEAILAHDRRCTDRIKAILAAEPRFVSIGALKPDGTIFCLGVELPPQGDSFSDRGWFWEVLDTLTFGRGHYLVGRISGERMILFAYPAMKEGKIAAVVFAGINPRWLGHILAALPEKDFIDGYVVDRDGLVLARSRDGDQANGSRVDDPRFLDALRRGEENPFVAAGPLGQGERFYVLRPIEGMGNGLLYLAASMDSGDLARNQFLDILPIAFVFVLVAILAYLTAWQGADITILEPVRRLRAAIEHFQGGDPAARAGPTYAQDEIGMLARSFDAMAETIVRDQSMLHVSEIRFREQIGQLRQSAKELKQAIAYTRSLIETHPDPLMTIGSDGRIADVNEAAEEATGVPRTRLIGSDFAEYFTEPDKARAGYQLAFREKFVRNYPLVLRHATGRTTEVLCNAATYLDEAGAISGVFAARDVTEIRRAHQEIEQLNRELEQRVRERTAELESANKDLEGFSYSVAHDLRTPLRAIEGFSHILIEDYRGSLDAEGQRLLSVVCDNTARMARLIDDILGFSRVSRRELSFAETDMEALARAAIEELAPSRVGRDVTIAVGKLPPAVGDKTMLRQVWINLIGNAIKFTRPKSKAAIEIEGHPAGGEIVYSVKDNGVGFDMKYAHKLFGVFQRLHSTEEFEGTGIGLAIVKRIVSRHDGRVWAEGKTNEGATFYFTLPNRP